MSRLTLVLMQSAFCHYVCQQVDGIPIVPVAEAASLAGIVSVDSSACACLTNSRHRLRVINVSFQQERLFQ